MDFSYCYNMDRQEMKKQGVSTDVVPHVKIKLKED